MLDGRSSYDSYMRKSAGEFPEFRLKKTVRISILMRLSPILLLSVPFLCVKHKWVKQQEGK